MSDLTKLDEWRRLINEAEAGTPWAHQRELWNIQVIKDWAATNKPEDIARSPLEAFYHYVSFGVAIPPEVILSIYESIHIYMNAAGDIELEEAFFGPRTNAGNYSKRHQALLKRRVNDFALFVDQDETNDSIKDKARRFLITVTGADDSDESFETEVETLERYHRDFWKRKPEFYP